MTDSKKATAPTNSDRLTSAGTATVESGQVKNTETVKESRDITSNSPTQAVIKLLPPGLFMTDDHKYYFNGNGPVPSVTTVTDALMKWDLMAWKQREAAKAMYRLLGPEEPSRFVPDSEEDAVKWAISEADKKRDDAAKIGTGVHLLADMHSRGADSVQEGFEVPDEWIPYLDAFKGFLGRYGAQNIVSSEKAVWSENGYAGTYDLIMRMPLDDSVEAFEGTNWPLCLIDIKTSKGIYPEMGLQLAGYRWADAIILPGDPRPYPMPQIDRTFILHLRPDKYPDTGYRLVEYGTTYMDDYIPFLGVLEAVKWRLKGRFTRTQLQKQSSI